MSEWTTTAEQDGDLAIVEGSRLIGVAATVRQATQICDAHKADIAKERSEQVGIENQFGAAFTEMEKEIKKLREQLATSHGCLRGMRQALVDAGGFERTISAIDTILLKR